MAFRSISTVVAAATSISVPPPSGIVDGDILIAFAISDSAGTTFTWPAGFTDLTGSPLTSTADGSRLGVATKKASGESGNYTLTQGGGDAIIGGVICQSGRDGTLYLHRIASGTQSTAQASPWSITSGTFTGGNTSGICDLVFIGDSDVTSLSDATHAAPSTFTLRADLADSTTPGSAFIQGMVATKDDVAAGETGAYTGTGTAVGVTSGWCVFVIALLKASTATPTPRPASYSFLARVREKLAARTNPLRGRGGKWFNAYLPWTSPLRNTTLVPAKWIPLSSRIGATVIQRATTGILWIIVGGRQAATKRMMRLIATRGRLFTKQGVAMRVPTGTPAAWIVRSSIVGSALIEQPTTGTVAALFTQRDHTDKLLARRLASTGHVMARRWLPPPPLQVSKLPRPAMIGGRAHAERVAAMRRSSTVAYDTSLMILPAPSTPFLPGARGLTTNLRTLEARRAHIRHERAGAWTWMYRPQVVASPKPLPIPKRWFIENRVAWATRARRRHEDHQFIASMFVVIPPGSPPPPPVVVVDDRRRWVGGVWRGG